LLRRSSAVVAMKTFVLVVLHCVLMVDGAMGPALTQKKAKCADLNAPENAVCKPVVEWAAGRSDPSAKQFFGDMPAITGVDYEQGSEGDFQRLYFCSPPGGKACGLAPCSCSKEPCDTCFGGGGGPAQPQRPGDCSSIDCKPPKTPFGYKGRAWPTMTFPGVKEMHIFAIGDWGGMDGSLNPIEGRHPIVAYPWGKRPGPSVFPRSRADKVGNVMYCNHVMLTHCFKTRGQGDCDPACGYVAELDENAQMLVADSFKKRAALKDPQFIINVGDNFYWGGIEKTCGTPMDKLSFTAQHQFSQIYEGIYQGPGLSGKPWLSVLGNHDWGGFVFNNGWDQQIAYTWFSKRWILPAPYWSLRVVYPDQDFDVDLYFLDSNFVDAKEPSQDSEHNICSSKHNKKDADCSLADGPPSIEGCPGYFQALWAEQQQWLERLLPQSKATWQVVVTHFPCGHEQSWYKKLHQQMGLDLLVTGHRHDQELWDPDFEMNKMGGLTCFVTGGGGGITSEATPDPTNTKDWYGEAQYGFYDLTISKSSIVIESINYDGKLLKTAVVKPR
jgi:hypothetical protein